MLRKIYLGTFLYSVQLALLVFINSSFLGNYVSIQTVGILYIVANVLNILGLIILPDLLLRFGHLRTFIGLVSLTVIALFGLAFLQYPPLLLLLFLLPEAIFMIVRAVIDVYVEEYSSVNTTGSTRGIFMTIINTSVALSPLLLGALVVGNNYRQVFLTAGLVNVLLVIVALIFFRKIPDIKYDHTPFWQSIKKVWRNSDLRNVFASNFLLQFFFAWMTIYTPIYLHTTIGLGWSKIGIIFFIMLLPYIFIEIPLGKIADKYLGEKELLTIGFILVAITTAILAFITSTTVILWAILLFATRIGAAMIEIMSETYFWKKVTAGDTEEISLFRDTKLLAYILGPLIGGAFLLFIHPSYLFLILGLIMFAGAYFPSRLHDTK